MSEIIEKGEDLTVKGWFRDFYIHPDRYDKESSIEDKVYKAFDEFQYFSGVTRIPDSMFEQWNLLTSITLPQGLTGIPGSCFRGCTRIKNIIAT